MKGYISLGDEFLLNVHDIVAVSKAALPKAQLKAGFNSRVFLRGTEAGERTWDTAFTVKQIKNKIAQALGKGGD